MKKKKTALWYSIGLIILIALMLFLISYKNTDPKEQVLKFRDKDFYTFTKTDETINFQINKKDDYILFFDAKPENAPAILDIRYNDLLTNITINKNSKYNITLNDLDGVLEVSLDSSKATPNIENINLKDIKGENLVKDSEKIIFAHETDKALFTKNLKKLNYILEFKVRGNDAQVPVKLNIFYNNTSKNVEINKKITEYSTQKIELGTLEGEQTFEFEPGTLTFEDKGKIYYQTIFIKDIKLIKPSGDKKVTISNITLTRT